MFDQTFKILLYTIDGQQILRRLQIDGSVDVGFAQAGRLDLRDAAQGGLYCSTKAMTSNRRHLFVADSCNARVLRFTETGAYRGTLRLPTLADERIESMLAEDGRLWILTNQRLLTYKDASDYPLVLEKQASFRGKVSWNQPTGMVRDRMGTFWVLDHFARLVGFDEQANILVSWYHPLTDPPSRGALSEPVGLVALPSGDLAVLAQGGRHLQIFRVGSRGARR